MPFEFTKLPVPIGYDYILSEIYGDYNQIVRSDTVHGSTIFDTDKDYRTVLSTEYGNKKYNDK